MSEFLKNNIPNSLDDIVQAHANELNITRVGHAAIEKYKVCSTKWDNLSGTICNGYLISFDLKLIDREYFEPNIYLFGWHEQYDCVFNTSPIRAVSSDMKFVRTKSGSIYEIASLAMDEPSPELLIHVCVLLNSMGLGPYFGVPRWFY